MHVSGYGLVMTSVVWRDGATANTWFLTWTNPCCSTTSLLVWQTLAAKTSLFFCSVSPLSVLFLPWMNLQLPWITFVLEVLHTSAVSAVFLVRTNVVGAKFGSGPVLPQPVDFGQVVWRPSVAEKPKVGTGQNRWILWEPEATSKQLFWEKRHVLIILYCNRFPNSVVDFWLCPDGRFAHSWVGAEALLSTLFMSHPYSKELKSNVYLDFPILILTALRWGQLRPEGVSGPRSPSALHLWA